MGTGRTHNVVLWFLRRIAWRVQGWVERLEGESPVAELASEDKALLSRNGNSRDCHRGRRAFVIGNGPSLARQDLGCLSSEVTFVCNAFWKHAIVSRWQPSYYCFADPLYFDGSAACAEFFRQLRARIQTTTFLLPLRAAGVVQSQRLVPAEQARYVALDGDISEGAGDSIDLTTRIPGVQCVAQLAMMAAIYMGCSPIYLLGMDHDWLSHRGLDRHFYPDNTMQNHPGDDSDLGESYSYKWLMHCMMVAWDGYEHLHAYAAKHGQQIVNATDGGFLDVFPRARYEDVIAVGRRAGTAAADHRPGQPLQDALCQ